MKKLIFSSLSALLLFTIIAPGVKAQSEENAADRVEQGQEYTEKRMSAFALVSAAYRGRFEDWDIPSYTTLETEYGAGNVTAKDVVSAGVEAGELAPQAADDDDYINSVESELNALEGN